MKKKELYSRPSSELLELNYAEPVCNTVSGDIPGYDPLDPPIFDSPIMDSLF